jgi:hypothetical protein
MSNEPRLIAEVGPVAIGRTPDTDLAQALTWIWLGVVAILVLAYVVFRAWRKPHPATRRKHEMKYSKRLTQRLSKHPVSKAKQPDRPQRHGRHP